MEIIIAIVISYLIGSISFSYIITKKIKKIDIRHHGSGNAGATNTLRLLGVGPAVTVLLLDMAKGIFAVLVTLWIVGPGWAPALAGLAAILGHNWPVYYGFRGGKGVATTIGVMASIVFIPSLIGGVIAIISIATTRFVSLGSLLFMVATTIATIWLANIYNYPMAYFYLSLTVTVLSFWRHRQNVVRLLQGKESKLGKKATT
ncbi:acyl-phosphate glycerol 3-phosphate acyltransferase [Alkalihalophilus pseudofirmus]|uniref:glycerol-3-phosphate 1-O-acyltransferase PlsY n=1 Tax=Alkalihalobacterium alkalinitrilicum TaxID=427920 RepID=UPI00094C3776|nr:glycerol-3-phosphate 1-O-acyltransferase PlsY [Alkalihalobacterium alkalinitrilicum]OLO42580.1 acyl-phosphate glycerol 3-phosphate acyltransferase [Alkalihalophilus pseudofirmus]